MALTPRQQAMRRYWKQARQENRLMHYFDQLAWKYLNLQVNHQPEIMISYVEGELRHVEIVLSKLGTTN